MCKFCEIREGNFYSEGYAESQCMSSWDGRGERSYFCIDEDNALFHFNAVGDDWASITIRFCPMCGRELDPANAFKPVSPVLLGRAL